MTGSVLGHASESKHSLFLPGAKAPHFNYVGDSILGSNVNLGAGVKLSNLRNDGAHIGIWLDGALSGSIDLPRVTFRTLARSIDRPRVIFRNRAGSIDSSRETFLILA